jgi:hypothetical protein
VDAGVGDVARAGEQSAQKDCEDDLHVRPLGS